MNGPVDLRSDTVTRPTPAMRRAMAEAEVGDDDYGEDPTVRALEEAFAARVGKAAALFVASGVMANQVALRVLCAPGTVVVAGRRQHVVAYEYGAAAKNAGVQFHTVDDADGMVRADDVTEARRSSEHHHPAVSLVSIENTHMAASGAVWSEARLRVLAEAAGPVPIHLDGARLFNAEAATGVAAAEWARPATTVMCCLSKGLCAPVGSLLAGDRRRRGRRPASSASASGAACARPACSPRRAWWRCGTWSAACPRTTRGRPDWPTPSRPAGRRAAWTPRRCAPTSSPSTTPTPRSCSTTWASTASWPMPSRRGRSAS